MKMTIIWIEHDMQMIADLADRIHVLDYGRTIAEGIPETVLSNPAVLSAYIGTPDPRGRDTPMNCPKLATKNGAVITFCTAAFL